MTNDLIIHGTDDRLPAIRPEVGEAANAAAARSAFADYRSRKAINTLKRQDRALTLFGVYLGEVTSDTHTGEALATDPEAWSGVTWGLVRGFVAWLLLRSYAVGSINGHLSSIKTYCKLCARAGVLTVREYTLIRGVEGYSRKEGRNADEKRQLAGVPIRCGHKKRDPVILTPDQVTTLKAQPDTPQGRRDALLLGLLCDLGLRCGELAELTVGNIELKRGKLKFFRRKVDKWQTLDLLNGLQGVAEAYMQHALPIGPLLRASVSKRAGKAAWEAGKLSHAGMSTRAITRRVRYLGKQLLGIENLSAHDLRHSWATLAAAAGTPILALRKAGGWNSIAMPARYVADSEVANEGVKLA